DDRESNRHTPERIGAHTTQAALRWLQNAPHDRPFLLWVHYQDPHGPYTPPREYQSAFLDESAKGDLLRVTDSVKGQGGIPSYQMLEHHRERGYYVAQYDAEILYYDQCLHDLVDGLRSGGWWDSSLVVWTSDHGEGMGEHEYYFAHGDYLYPSQLRVPLGLWGKGVAPGVVDSTLAQSSDIVPTVLAAAGIEPRIPLPGRNLLAPGGAPSGPHRPVPADAMIFSETLASDNYKAALTSPALQLVYDQFNADYQPYDPATDVFLDPDSLSGSIDLAKVTARLEELRNKNASRSSGHGMSDQEAELMKSLGYIN
ncbi:MAG: sulfatase-like hydrolase/transferase, partial [Candidatus Eisenbacteria bacterium]|nr:sulfatase-like hydrolase/transferase [Candidatus Eisenbacteria bacterium]